MRKPRAKPEPLMITLKWLRENGACLTSRKAFRETFGDSAELTLRNIRAMDKRINASVACWLAHRLLSIADEQAYRIERDAHDWLNCSDGCDKLLMEYHRRGQCRLTNA